MKTYGNTARAGFSLVEMMCAALLASLLVLALAVVFLTHFKAYRDEILVREMQENLRFASDALARDLRMTGYGLDVRRSELSSWLSWVSGMSSNPVVIDGGGDSPDTISVAAAFDLPTATLSQAAAAGSTTLRLAGANAADFNTTDRSVIYVGRAETARVIAASVDTLTVSTDPTNSGSGLVFEHPAGSPVELVQIHTYSCGSNTTYDAGQLYLSLDDNSGSITQDWQRMVAGHITDFQVSAESNSVSITIEARTPRQLYSYTDPVHGDSYQRATVTTRVTPRNSFAFILRH